jgi:hypothetical protein
MNLAEPAVYQGRFACFHVKTLNPDYMCAVSDAHEISVTRDLHTEMGQMSKVYGSAKGGPVFT